MNYTLVRSSFSRVSVLLHDVRQLQARSLIQAPQVLVYKYMDQNSSAAILSVKRSAGAKIEVEVNLRNLLYAVIKHTSKAMQCRHHQKSKTGVSLTHIKN